MKEPEPVLRHNYWAEYSAAVVEIEKLREQLNAAEASLVSERMAFQRSILALRVQLERKS